MKRSLGAAVVVLAVVLIAGGLYYYYNYNHNEDSSAQAPDTATPASSKSWDAFHVVSQITGISDFDLNYPAELGTPVVSLSTYTETPVQNITFYQPGSPHNYPHIDSSYFLNIGFDLGTIKEGQTLEDVVGTKSVQYSLKVDGHRTIAQATSASSPLTWYSIELQNNSILGILFDISGNSQINAADFRTTEDKIVQSIKFVK